MAPPCCYFNMPKESLLKGPPAAPAHPVPHIPKASILTERVQPRPPGVRPPARRILGHQMGPRPPGVVPPPAELLGYQIPREFNKAAPQEPPLP